MKDNCFLLKILTPLGSKNVDNVESINFQADNGFISILKNHAAISGLIKPGKCSILMNGERKTFYHSVGMFSFINNELKFIVDKFQQEEFDIQKSIWEEDNKKMIIGNNEIITNYHFIKDNINHKNEIIEFEFKRLIKGIK
ncbi:MAG: hypothetical protein ACRCVI_02320 [Mycoplasmoidaceae bacterium]